jgi:hypothetical protein
MPSCAFRLRFHANEGEDISTDFHPSILIGSCNQEVAVGWANLIPAEGSQALSLMAGAAIGQQTATPWSSLSVGDTLTGSKWLDANK